MKTLAVIGGSGTYGVPGLRVTNEHDCITPYGSPSSTIVEGELEGLRLLFLPRHGNEHSIAPHEINYRANVCALKKLGATQVLSLSAVGSLREDFKPGDVVLVDQYIDLTKRRVATFFEGGAVAHVSFADPVCATLSDAAARAAEAVGSVVHRGATYICIEGPAFSTRAESRLYKSWGAGVIGMTALPEAKLAREAELAYATVAFVTDYDAWHETEVPVSVEAVLAVLQKNGQLAQKLLAELPSLLPASLDSPATRALEGALLTRPEHLSEALRAQLNWLLPHSSTS